jgi:DNA invertase Pin-like site-specific DNA recombinase
MRAGLYARVSTDEQDEGMQLAELREFCDRRGWSYEIFADPGQSGAKLSRPQLDRMMKLCRARKLDVVVVYRFDRFARSTKQLVDALAEFDRLGIQFVSLHEQVDTSTPNGKLLFHIFAAIAEFERTLTIDRIKSGLAHARTRGRIGGRRRKVVDVEKIRELRHRGLAWRDIAKLVGVSRATAQRALLMAQKPPSDALQ